MCCLYYVCMTFYDGEVSPGHEKEIGAKLYIIAVPKFNPLQ